MAPSVFAYTICEECLGKRFEASVLEHRLGGRDISEVLAMSVTGAQEFFGTDEAIFEGTPAVLVAARSTLTGEHLAAYVGS